MRNILIILLVFLVIGTSFALSASYDVQKGLFYNKTTGRLNSQIYTFNLTNPTTSQVLDFYINTTSPAQIHLILNGQYRTPAMLATNQYKYDNITFPRGQNNFSLWFSINARPFSSGKWNISIYDANSINELLHIDPYWNSTGFEKAPIKIQTTPSNYELFDSQYGFLGYMNWVLEADGQIFSLNNLNIDEFSNNTNMFQYALSNNNSYNITTQFSKKALKGSMDINVSPRTAVPNKNWVVYYDFDWNNTNTIRWLEDIHAFDIYKPISPYAGYSSKIGFDDAVNQGYAVTYINQTRIKITIGNAQGFFLDPTFSNIGKVDGGVATFNDTSPTTFDVSVCFLPRGKTNTTHPRYSIESNAGGVFCQGTFNFANSNYGGSVDYINEQTNFTPMRVEICHDDATLNHLFKISIWNGTTCIDPTKQLGINWTFDIPMAPLNGISCQSQDGTTNDFFYNETGEMRILYARDTPGVGGDAACMGAGDSIVIAPNFTSVDISTKASGISKYNFFENASISYHLNASSRLTTSGGAIDMNITNASHVITRNNTCTTLRDGLNQCNVSLRNFALHPHNDFLWNFTFVNWSMVNDHFRFTGGGDVGFNASRINPNVQFNITSTLTCNSITNADGRQVLGNTLYNRGETPNWNGNVQNIRGENWNKVWTQFRYGDFNGSSPYRNTQLQSGTFTISAGAWTTDTLIPTTSNASYDYLGVTYNRTINTTSTFDSNIFSFNNCTYGEIYNVSRKLRLGTDASALNGLLNSNITSFIFRSNISNRGEEINFSTIVTAADGTAYPASANPAIIMAINASNNFVVQTLSTFNVLTTGNPNNLSWAFTWGTTDTAIEYNTSRPSFGSPYYFTIRSFGSGNEFNTTTNSTMNLTTTLFAHTHTQLSSTLDRDTSLCPNEVFSNDNLTFIIASQVVNQFGYVSDIRCTPLSTVSGTCRVFKPSGDQIGIDVGRTTDTDGWFTTACDKSAEAPEGNWTFAWFGSYKGNSFYDNQSVVFVSPLSADRIVILAFKNLNRSNYETKQNDTLEVSCEWNKRASGVWIPQTVTNPTLTITNDSGGEVISNLVMIGNSLISKVNITLNGSFDLQQIIRGKCHATVSVDDFIGEDSLDPRSASASAITSNYEIALGIAPAILSFVLAILTYGFIIYRRSDGLLALFLFGTLLMITVDLGILMNIADNNNETNISTVLTGIYTLAIFALSMVFIYWVIKMIITGIMMHKQRKFGGGELS